MSVVVVSCMALLVSQTCMAGSSEFRFYPQFRYMGGLPGNGWAVNGQGEAGFDGAMSQTIPIGYTPSRGSYALGYHVGSTNGGITTSFGGPGANGTLAGTIGFRRPGHGISATVDFVDNDWDVSFNFQAQIAQETDHRPAISGGILDWSRRREEMRGNPPNDHSAQSFYIAATKRFNDGDHPIHATLGVGTDRFRERSFAGVCYDAHDRVKLMAEYDGFGMNAAAAAQVLPDKRKSDGSQGDSLILFIGATDLERPVVGVTYTR
jgi:hypothetical protein